MDPLAVDNLVFARGQMAMSLIFHIVFAAIGIGMPLLMVIAEGLHLRTRRPHYLALARKWANVTGLLFAIGAVSGTALAFELGLLWPRYIEITGPVVGHAFALEGYAFFIEAIFIGLYLYGWDRLGPVAHWACAVVIAVSGAASGVLVLAVNAWMQLPLGFRLDPAGHVISTQPWAILKTYAWFVMSLHSTLACYTAVGLAVAAVYAWGILRGRDDAYHRAAVLIAMAVGAAGAVAQPVAGDMIAKFVYRTQPAKFAAMESQFSTQTHAPIHIGGWPDLNARTDRGAIEIPGGLSFLATHDPNARVTGLDDIPRENWPNVAVTHFAFDVMVGLGTLAAIAGALFWIAYARKRGAAFDRKWLLWTVVLCGPLGFVALEAGWVVTEVGRQPWVINGVLRTADAVTPSGSVPATFYLFSALYLTLGVVTVVLLNHLRTPGGESFAKPQAAGPPRGELRLT